MPEPPPSAVRDTRSSRWRLRTRRRTRLCNSYADTRARIRHPFCPNLGARTRPSKRRPATPRLLTPAGRERQDRFVAASNGVSLDRAGLLRVPWNASVDSPTSVLIRHLTCSLLPAGETVIPPGDHAGMEEPESAAASRRIQRSITEARIQL